MRSLRNVMRMLAWSARKVDRLSTQRVMVSLSIVEQRHPLAGHVGDVGRAVGGFRDGELRDARIDRADGSFRRRGAHPVGAGVQPYPAVGHGDDRQAVAADGQHRVGVQVRPGLYQGLIAMAEQLGRGRSPGRDRRGARVGRRAGSAVSADGEGGLRSCRRVGPCGCTSGRHTTGSRRPTVRLADRLAVVRRGSRWRRPPGRPVPRPPCTSPRSCSSRWPPGSPP